MIKYLILSQIKCDLPKTLMSSCLLSEIFIVDFCPETLMIY